MVPGSTKSAGITSVPIAGSRRDPVTFLCQESFDGGHTIELVGELRDSVARKRQAELVQCVVDDLDPVITGNGRVAAELSCGLRVLGKVLKGEKVSRRRQRCVGP